MPTNDNMTTPLTRRDLEEVLDQRLANHPTHEQLTTALANHPTREQLTAALANHPTHEHLAAALANQHALFVAEVRAMNAVLLEDAFKRFRVIDDQYKDLPGRVQKLEEAVFPPMPRARRKRSG